MYQVKDWQVHFENNKSRERDHCRYVCIPNKQGGAGLTHILAQEDGLSIYGIWCLIVGACSRQRRPRDGYLTDDGTPKGRAWTTGALAVRWRCAAEQVARALEVLASEEVGWIAVIPEQGKAYSDTEQVPAKCPPSARQVSRKGMERNGMEPPTPKGVGEPAGFIRFWTAWPTHRRKVDRANCLRHWNRAELEPIAEQVIQGLRRWKVSSEWQGGYVPLVKTWLNQRRWESVLEVPETEPLNETRVRE